MSELVKRFNEVEEVGRLVPLPAHWRMGGHGDPIAVFDYLTLVLHEDGTVTWRKETP